MHKLISSCTGRAGRISAGLIAVTLALAVGGCKLKVYVPTGAGYVESTSGAFHCSLMSVCNLDIVDTGFEETFRAVPHEGFIFAGWKDRPQGLYANSIGDAYITSAVPATNQALMDLLASDETFYLEPRFIEMDAFEWRPRGEGLSGSRSMPVDQVELSADGDVYATIDEGAAGIQASVFEWTGSRWRKRGDTVGQADSGQVVAIALSRDGLVLACASTTPDRANEVSVFQWNGSEWQSLGATIGGEHPGDEAGALALSADGRYLVMGAAANADGGRSAGHVRVFRWDGEDWRQLGEDIDGSEETMFGAAVDISANGRVIAVGAPARSDAGSTLTGSVGTYVWDGTGWRLRGETLAGHDPQDGFGRYLSLSASGVHLAVGSESTYARVFYWDGSDWAGRGYTLHSDMTYIDRVDVDISDSGGIVAISEPGYGLRASWSGEGWVRVLIWDGRKWVRLGDPVYGDSGCPDGYDCPAGRARAGRLSADGSVLAMVDSGTGNERDRGGRVRVFAGED